MMPIADDRRAFGQHPHQQQVRRRADREPHAELARPRADAERQHAGDADHRDQQRDAGEAGEHERVEALGREHFGAHVFERRGALDRLIGRQCPGRSASSAARARTDRPRRARTCRPATPICCSG